MHKLSLLFTTDPDSEFETYEDPERNSKEILKCLTTEIEINLSKRFHGGYYVALGAHSTPRF